MKELPSDCEVLFQNDSREASKHIAFALDGLFNDNSRSIHDKVAGDMYYEELIRALFCAKKRITELED